MSKKLMLATWLVGAGLGESSLGVIPSRIFDVNPTPYKDKNKYNLTKEQQEYIKTLNPKAKRNYLKRLQDDKNG